MADIDITAQSIPLGDARTLEVDFSQTATNFGTSVSSCAWSVKTGTTIGTISNEALASQVATALFTTTTVSGSALIAATATMADSQTATHYFCITAEQPTC